MVYVRRWESFVEASRMLYDASPDTCRFCIRWRYDLGLMVLKITDDEKCIKFKTRSSVFLNRFEALSKSLRARMQNLAPLSPSLVEPGTVPLSAEVAHAQESSAAVGSASVPSQKTAGQATNTPGMATTVTVQSGSKKKKKGKKK